MNSKLKFRLFHAVSLAFNVAIVVITWYSILSMIFGDEEGNMLLGAETFRYFTNLSNILVAICCMPVITFNINSLITGDGYIPTWARVTKFVGTISVTVTFLTVVLFLGPTIGWGIMFAGPCLYLHLITPLLAIISCGCVEVGQKLSFKSSFFGLIPTFLYSIVYIITVAIICVWEDFYGFTFGGKLWTIPLSLIGMYLATYLFSFALNKLQNVMYKVVSKI